MKSLSLLILIMSAQFASAAVCGLYQFNDYGDRNSLTISDFMTMNPQTTNYQITNVESPMVQTLVTGLCYCVDGDVSADPAYPGDYLYKSLVIHKVVSGPLNNCHPATPPSY